VMVHRDSAQAYTFLKRWHDPLYVNPFTGETKQTLSGQIQDVIHVLEAIHRWLGLQDDLYPTGRLITGICNLAFVVLCVTGIYLWWPKVMRGTVWRRALWFSKNRTTRARDFSWHNVIGIWSLPVLTVLAVTAVAISFAWGHSLVFRFFGEEAPESRNYGMMAVPPQVVPSPALGSTRLPFETLINEVKIDFPEWQSIELQFPPAEQVAGTVPVAPINLGVILPDYMPSRAYVPVESDPFTGEILQAVHFTNRSPGLQTRVWIRFLHTGAGLGLPGKIIASFASLGSLVLVYTGFALAWRRFFARKPGRLTAS